MRDIFAVILAGGKGERFWPKSRANYPKQMLPLLGQNSMLQETLQRLSPLVKNENILVITHQDFVSLVKFLAKDFPGIKIIGEPEGKNTAPAIAIAARLIFKENPEGIMIVLPADHEIKGGQQFQTALQLATEIAENDYLVTLGIKPTFPATGYGYIEKEKEICHRKKAKAFKVARFKEKPNLKEAKRFFSAGRYFWNAGIFVWKAKTIMQALEKYLPSLYHSFQKWNGQENDLADFYGQLQKISIDYGILEKAPNVVVVQGDFFWNDLGSWETLYCLLPKDTNGNVSQGETLLLDTHNSLIVSDQGLMATLGVENLVIVRTKDITLVCKKGKDQEIKRIVEALTNSKTLKKYL
ncbi:MAG: mannose-1-phosphate guanylyltransferase [Candidatus Edwardsbacteria bacterium]